VQDTEEKSQVIAPISLSIWEDIQEVCRRGRKSSENVDQTANCAAGVASYLPQRRAIQRPPQVLRSRLVISSTLGHTWTRRVPGRQAKIIL
jgi:hypothetical protein